MRRLAALLVTSATTACSGVAVYPIAVGATGTVPTWNGPCAPARARGDAAQLDGSRYVAVRAGDLELPCRDGDVRLEVREVARLVIEGPSALGSGYVSYRLVAYDGDARALDLGNADVAWTIPESVERGPACHGEMVAVCDPPSVVRLRSSGQGGVIEVSFGGVRTSRSLGGAP